MFRDMILTSYMHIRYNHAMLLTSSMHIGRLCPLLRSPPCSQCYSDDGCLVGTGRSRASELLLRRPHAHPGLPSGSTSSSGSGGSKGSSPVRPQITNTSQLFWVQAHEERSCGTKVRHLPARLQLACSPTVQRRFDAVVLPILAIAAFHAASASQTAVTASTTAHAAHHMSKQVHLDVHPHMCTQIVCHVHALSAERTHRRGPALRICK